MIYDKKGGAMLSLIIAALIGTAVMTSFFTLYSDTINIYGLEPFDEDISAFNNTGTYEENARNIRQSVEGDTQVSTRLSEVNFINAGFTSILKAGTAVAALSDMIYRAAEISFVPPYITLALVGVLMAVFAFAIMKLITGRD